MHREMVCQHQPQPRSAARSNITLCTKCLFLFLPAGIIVLLSACYGLISLVAIFGNCLVIFVVWATRSMRNVTNFYIANLASADVFIAVFCIPFQGT